MIIETGQIFININQPIKYPPIKIMACVDGYVMAKKVEIGEPFLMEQLDFKMVYIDACKYTLAP